MLSKIFDLEINGHELQFGFIISREILFLENNNRYVCTWFALHAPYNLWFVHSLGSVCQHLYKEVADTVKAQSLLIQYSNSASDYAILNKIYKPSLPGGHQ